MNAQGKFKLVNPHFHSMNFGKCDLLMRITPSHISLAVINKEHNQISALADFPLNEKNHLTDILTQEELLNFPYRKVKTALQSFKFTFIPSSVYSDSSLKDYNKFIQADPASLFINEISSQQIKTITSFDRNLTHLLNEKFSHLQLTSTANPLIEAISKLYENGKQLILNFDINTFEAVVLDSGQLLFYNIFSITTANDFNYFLLLLLQQLNLSPTEINPIICGEIDTSSEIYQRITKYFNQTKFADSNLLVNIPSSFGLEPVYRFFSLFGLSLCE